ncbi:MAG: RNA polymerase sigma factor [Gemmatimonadetes bacterium]|nr:RNA polymerase sigma factor [Gemmatimonadota bacterium]NNK49051.1 RNA polymerase sigma factor [Gemmatimonadota bacterium]
MRSAESLAEEQALVRAVQDGDDDAFGALVDRYLEAAFATALSVLRNTHDAEDAVQSAFIRALERIDQLKPGSPFGPWFYRVLRSTCLNLRRREALRSHEEIPVSAAGGRNPDRDLQEELTRETVMVALGELPEMQRLAITLYDLEGYSHQEIGDILGIAVGTSRAHVHHARRALRKLIGPIVGADEGYSELTEPR